MGFDIAPIAILLFHWEFPWPISFVNYFSIFYMMSPLWFSDLKSKNASKTKSTEQ